MFRKIAAVLGVLVVVGWGAGPAQATPVSPWSSFFVFGDSQSDPGNLFAATGGADPASPPYFNGRFSNGPVWAESIAAGFVSSGRVTANFAFGGAQAVTNGDAIPDFQLQRGLFGATVPPAALGARPLAALWFGANDLFSAIDSLALGLLAVGDVEAAGRSAANAVVAGASQLSLAGIHDFLVFNLPDLGRVPAYALLNPTLAAGATAGSNAFNAALDLGMGGLRSAGLNVIDIDIAALFADLLADPASFGVSNTTDPCLIPGISLCTPAEADQRAFFDPVHPSARLHGAISDTVDAAITPVPEPSSVSLLLLAGLAALASLRARPRA